MEDRRDITTIEVVEGEVDVIVDGAQPVRVFVPAGVGVPGFDDADVAGALVAELLARGDDILPVIDVSQALGSDPSLIAAVEHRLTR